MYSANVFAKFFRAGRRRLVLISAILCAVQVLPQPLSAQVDQVRFKMHLPTMPSQATSWQVREIEILGGATPGMLAVGYVTRTDRPGAGASALLYDPSALIDPASTYLGQTPPIGNLWDGYDLIGPPDQWDQNWDDNTVHESYNQLVFYNINAGGLVVGYLVNGAGGRIPVYLDLFPASGTLELKRIPLPAGATGSSKTMYVNQAGEILVQPRDANDVILDPYIFKPARNGASEVRTLVSYLAGSETLRGFNSLGQVMTDDNDTVARHTLGAGTTQQFPDYQLRTISTGFTETFAELIRLPDDTYNGALNEFGQFIGTFYVSKGPGRGRWAARYGGLPLATKEREWQPPITGFDRVDALNDSGDAIDDLPQGNQEVGINAYYYHEGLPGEGDETFISSVKSLIISESDPNNIFFDTGSISNDVISNRNSSDFGWLYGTYPNGADTTGIAFLEPIIPGQTPGISVAPVTGLVTSETGDSDSFEIVLDAQPTADVTIAISSSNESEGTVNPTSLTFTSENWDEAQPVTITGQGDELPDGNDVAYTIVTAPAVSTDPNYHELDAEDVQVTNLDPSNGGSETYEATDIPQEGLDIPDNNQGVATSDILAGDHLITNLTVNVDITHPRPGDLDVYLIGPDDGPPVRLADVADFNGTSSLGLWTLKVYDTKKRKTGTLNGWSITVDY